MSEKIENHLTKQLGKALLLVESEKEMLNFLEDLCTISEFKSLSQRLEVARMLHAGDKYEEIVRKTGCSTATISRVKRCLVYGKDGYTSVLTKLALQQPESEEERGAKVARRVKFQKERAARRVVLHSKGINSGRKSTK